MSVPAITARVSVPAANKIDLFVAFLTGDDIDVKQWPFVRWFIEEYIIPQIHQDYELNEVYKGVYAAPTPGTAGAVSTSMNGIGKTIADAILDRVIHSAIRFELKGESMRKKMKK